ncbi:MAG: Flp pilus assembly complex ATPase component TadA [Akkermansiaceae bacterium]|nr:Flp pilus assembly complex ATPase component TadA [Akkermansiaceae bacterium]NNM28774.1 Flp pilus assembly complex ATPase component TadA [Akkermansiaceae bacterium]
MAEFIDDLANYAFETGATDLFLREGDFPRVRTGGDIDTASDDRVGVDDLSAFWRRCGADPDTVTDRDLSYEIAGGRRLRVNLYRSLGQLSAVLRPIEETIPGFDELGLPAALLTPWLERYSGIILVTGPTGSGKSTSIASCLQWVNSRMARHIVTIEDPIEYLFHNDKSYFSQREILADTDSFAVALRSSLRQSPDIVLLGEIRDEESALIALRAAETGHLVLSTLHSSGVTDTLERLINLFSPAERESALVLLANHLVGILCQQLLPRNGGGLFLALEHLQNEAVTRKWIRECNLPEIADLLHRVDSPANASFLRHLVAAAEQDILDVEVARAACPNPSDFDRALKGIA